MKTRLTLILTILISILLLFSTTYSYDFKEHKVTLPLSFDYYYSYGMIVDALKLLNKAFPELTKLKIVGKSEEGRAIYCMTINNPKTGKELDKPGVFVDSNIHGNEIQAGEVALYLMDYLLHNYGTNKEITKLVDKNCFYVIPVVNPDGRYHFLHDPNGSGNRGLRRPHDDDRDGLLDEDFPEDLDGDGQILRMRKRDPNGQYKADPEDPRLMIRVKPGEKGEWTMLGSEGIDNDGDGRINEDAEGYVDPNRNWGFNWNPPYVQAGSGDYPFSGLGTRALGKLTRKLTNICVYWSFHNTGGVYLRGPATKAQGEFPRQDVEVYDFLGEQSERITPGYKYIILWKDFYETYGDTIGWMTKVNGAFGFVGELFRVQSETFKSIKEKKKDKPAEGGVMDVFGNDPSVQRERLKFNDHLTQGELYTSWKAFKHPTFGDIEIGGWTKLSTRISHPFMLKDMVHRVASTVIFSAKHTPEISLDIFENKKIDKNLFRIRTRLVNAKAIPSMSQQAVRDNIYPKDMLTVEGKGVKVMAGGQLRDIYRNQVTYKEFRPEIQFLTVPGFGKVEHQFLISGKGKVTIKYNSRHAGKISKTIVLGGKN